MERTVNEHWKVLRNAVLQSAANNIGYNKRREIKKPWVTQEMLDKMDERRRWKSDGTDIGKANYRRLNNELSRETDRARDIWWNGQCSDIEEFDRRGRSDLMYARIKQITSGHKKRDRITELKTNMENF